MALTLLLGLTERILSESDGRDIAVSPTKDPAAILLDKIVDDSPDAIDRELRRDDPGILEVGVVAAEGAAEDEAVGVFEENGEKTEPNTRFACALEASFLSFTRSLEGFFGSVASG